jgi:hypothetical protein
MMAPHVKKKARHGTARQRRQQRWPRIRLANRHRIARIGAASPTTLYIAHRVYITSEHRHMRKHAQVRILPSASPIADVAERSKA